MEDQPWLPDSIDDSFDPLDHADTHPGPETPIVVTPRGGTREVGRSCYQVDTQHGTYLVDCGLNQGAGETYPDLRGLDYGQVDAVILTHAHIDHTGGLPLLEARNLLEEDAPIIATEPTCDIARLLLEDSLKLHRRRCQEEGKNQQYTRQDLERIFKRFTPIDYGGGRLAGFDGPPNTEELVVQLEDAGHLLGSAWVNLMAGGRRAIFSGDLGGRAPHLSDITDPPEADLLLVESTYGATHSHTSMSDAQSTVIDKIKNAVERNEPVLIPTFAVGRAQLITLLLSDRLRQANLESDVNLVVDGMAQDAMDIYHRYARNDEFVDDALRNRVVESGFDKPFLPSGTTFPESDSDRQEILTDATHSTNRVPVIISPSGMLTGGNSPRYLVEFAARFSDATVLLTGYQAVNTTGRAIENQLKADNEELEIETDANPLGTDWPTSPDVEWVTTTTDTDTDERVTRTRATIPSEWINRVEGLSGHASQQALRSFTRDVQPPAVGLIHGPDYAQQALAEDLAKNVDTVSEVTRTRLLTPIPITTDIEFDTASLDADLLTDDDDRSLTEQVHDLSQAVARLNQEVADLRSQIE